MCQAVPAKPRTSLGRRLEDGSPSPPISSSTAPPCLPQACSEPATRLPQAGRPLCLAHGSWGWSEGSWGCRSILEQVLHASWGCSWAVDTTGIWGDHLLMRGSPSLT